MWTAGRRERAQWAAGVLGLSARNFGYNSVDLRVRIYAPQGFVYNSCVCLSIAFCEASSTAAVCPSLRVSVRAMGGVLGPCGSWWIWLESYSQGHLRVCVCVCTRACV